MPYILLVGVYDLPLMLHRVLLFVMCMYIFCCIYNNMMLLLFVCVVCKDLMCVACSSKVCVYICVCVDSGRE